MSRAAFAWSGTCLTSFDRKCDKKAALISERSDVPGPESSKRCGEHRRGEREGGRGQPSARAADRK